eukprot:1183712-Prorocentrum_minimum.AAC.1
MMCVDGCMEQAYTALSLVRLHRRVKSIHEAMKAFEHHTAPSRPAILLRVLRRVSVDVTVVACSMPSRWFLNFVGQAPQFNGIGPWPKAPREHIPGRVQKHGRRR